MKRKKGVVAHDAVPVEPAVVEAVVGPVVGRPVVERRTADGVLLNPEEFDVGADGVLRPKVK